MSTPTQNSVSATYLNTSGLSTYVLALVEWNFNGTLEGVKWGGGWGTGVALTYSFPGEGGQNADTTNPISSYGAHGGAEWSDGWTYLNSGEMSAVQSALAQWEMCGNVTFSQSADNSSTVGDLRFAISSAVDPNSGVRRRTPLVAMSGFRICGTPTRRPMSRLAATII